MIAPRRRGLALAALAAALCTAPAQERAVVFVAPFSSDDPMVGGLVTEAMRTGLAGDSFLQVVEAVEDGAREEGQETGAAAPARFLLDGSVSRADHGLIVAYRLVERDTGRVLAAGNAMLAEATFEQDLEGLSAALGNTLLSAWAGSTEKAIAILIASGRYDEAGRRLESFSVREPGHPALAGFRDRIARGRAEAWRRDAEEALAASREAVGYEALRLAERARDSLEAALLLMPSGPDDEGNRSALAAARSGHVEGALERGRREAREEAGDHATRLIAAGEPEAALEYLRDFMGLFGDWTKDSRILDLERRASLSRGRQLAAESAVALERDEIDFAFALASRAAGFTPEDPAVRAAVDRSGAAVAARAASESVEEESRWDLPPDFTAAWRLSAGVVVLGFRAADFSMPMDGVVPGLECGAGWRLDVAEGPRIGLGVSFACAWGDQELETWGEPGRLDQRIVAIDAGAELSWPVRLAGEARLAPGFGARMGIMGARYESAYPAAPAAGKEGLLAAPTARLAAFADLDWSGSWSARLEVSVAGTWIFGFGPAGGTRIAVSAGYGLD